MESLTIYVYMVIYRYRLEKKFPEERWKKRYKWHNDSHLVVCRHQAEIRSWLQNHLEDNSNGKYEVKIVEIEKVKNQ